MSGGIITEIHRAALNDGPGVRTAVFFKGCPLRCLWCHNPETQNPLPEPVNAPVNPFAHAKMPPDSKTCLPASGSFQGRLAEHDKRQVWGKYVTAEAVMDVVRLDAGHYAATGGGVTLTGGEPLFQPGFARELLTLAKGEGFHTCVETSGFAPVEALQPLLPLVDLWLFDIKGLPPKYPALVGGCFSVVEQALQTLLKNEAAVLLRCPIVPSIHDNEAYYGYLEGLAASHPCIIGYELLPFHRLGMDKYEALGRVAPMDFDNYDYN